MLVFVLLSLNLLTSDFIRFVLKSAKYIT